MHRPLLLLSLLASLSCKSSESKAPDLEHIPTGEEQVVGAVPPPSANADVDLYGDALPPGATGRLGSLRMVDRSIRQMIFTPEGSQVVSTHKSGYQVWDLTDGSRSTVLEHESPGDHMAVSPNGQILATGNDDGTGLQLWNLKSSQKGAEVKVSTALVGLCFLSNQLLMAAFEKGEVRIYDLAGESTVFQGPWEDPTTLSCALSPGWAAIGTASGEAYAIELAAAKTSVKRATKLGTVNKAIATTAISSDGKTFAFGSADENIYLWYAPEAAEPFSIQAHDRTVVNLAFSPDNTQLISTGGDSWFRKWNPKDGELIEEIPGIDGLDAQLMALSPDGNLMVSWSQHGGARGSEAGRWWLWNAKSGSLLLEPERHRGAITSVEFSPDGKQIATASEDKTVRLWNASTKSLGVLDGAGGSVNAVHFAKDGNSVLSAGTDALLRRWNPTTSATASRIEGVGGAINRFVATPDGYRIITGDQIGRVWAWDRATGNQIQAYDGGRYSAVYDLSISPNGKYLATAGSAPVVGVVDLQRGQEIAELNPGDAAANFAVAFSPDGSMLATAGDSHKIQIWSTVDWTRLKTLDGHDGTVRTLVFRPDSKTLISGGNDEMVRIWSVETGEQLAELAGHEGVVTSVAVSPDGSQLVSASRDRTALVWRMP